jgi:eukaryotic-like serine/threonine-protein kinase
MRPMSPSVHGTPVDGRPAAPAWLDESPAEATLVASPSGRSRPRAVGTGAPAAEERMCPTCRALFRRGAAHCPRDGAPLEAASFDPLVGRTFAGRYLIETVLGEGGMGRVYRARHLRMSRKFAIKVLHGEHATSPTMVMRFQREAEATSRLSHRNVVSVVDFGETDGGLFYLAMDYVDGTTLRRLMRDEGPLAGDRLLGLLEQLCAGLSHAHDRGLIHRDFKPDNILVEHTDDGELARIADFGIAVAPDHGPDAVDRRLTSEGLIVGTPHYMAPEQTTGHELDCRTDLYALGVVVYEMLSGTMPFDGPPSQVAQRHVDTDPPQIAERVPGLIVDPLIEALTMRLLAKRPEDRPQSAREVGALVRLLRTDRHAAVEALSIAAPPGTELETAPHREVECDAHHVLVRPPAREVRAARSETEAIWSAFPVWRGAAALLVGAAAAWLWIVGWQRLNPPPAVTEAAPVTEVAPPTTDGVAEAAPAPPPVVQEVSIPEPAMVAPPVVVEVPTAERRAGEERARERRRSRARRQAAPAVAPTALAPAPAERVATPDGAALKELIAEYRTVGAKLDALIAERGAAATAQLKRRYLAIPMADALRSPTLADEVARQVATLRRDIRRARRL